MHPKITYQTLINYVDEIQRVLYVRYILPLILQLFWIQALLVYFTA